MPNIVSWMTILGHNARRTFLSSMMASTAGIWDWESMLTGRKGNDNQKKIREKCEEINCLLTELVLRFGQANSSCHLTFSFVYVWMNNLCALLSRSTVERVMRPQMGCDVN